jgi:hypothetical protein
MALDPAAVSKGVERRITNGIAACAYYVETKKVKEAAARRGRWPLRLLSKNVRENVTILGRTVGKWMSTYIAIQLTGRNEGHTSPTKEYCLSNSRGNFSRLNESQRS